MAFCASAGSDLACSWHLAAKAALALGLPRACWKVAYCAAVTGVGGCVACWGAQAGSDAGREQEGEAGAEERTGWHGITSEAGPADHARSGAPLYVRFATGQTSPSSTSASAIWTAFSAAPLRRLSATTHRFRP